MTTIIKDKYTMLQADEGKYLTNGEIYTESVFLGKFDSAENWHEVDEMPPEESDDVDIDSLKAELKEAKTVNNILLGVEQ